MLTMMKLWYSCLLLTALLESMAFIVPIGQRQQRQEQRYSRSAKEDLGEILEALDERGIRYEASASKSDLERLLLGTASPNVEEKDADTNEKEQPREDTMTLGQILALLDSRNIKYSPSASRQELLEQYITTINDQPHQNQNQKQNQEQRYRQEIIQRRRRRQSSSSQKQQQQQQQQQSTIKNVVSSSNQFARRVKSVIPDHITTIQPKQIPRKVTNIAQTAVKQIDTFLDTNTNTDQDGIHEPEWDFQYVPNHHTDPTNTDNDRQTDKHNDTVIEVEVIPMTATASRNRKYTPPNVTQKIPLHDTNRHRNRQGYTSAEERIRTPQPNTPRTRHKYRRTIPTKTVYSVYGTTPHPNEDRPVDPNHLDDQQIDEKPRRQRSRHSRPPPHPNNNNNNNKKNRPIGPDNLNKQQVDEKPRRKTRRTARRGQSQARYWKDRLEERVDHFLGIYDVDFSYTKWEDEKEIRMHQPFKGVPKPKRSPKRGAFWDDEESLLALILGKSTMNPLHIRKYFDNGVPTNMLTASIGTFLRAGAILLSYVCRWASVKGALPHPVVTGAVATAAICAKRGQRFKWILGTLVLMRALGEMVHGYVHDYDYDDDDDDDVDDDVDDEYARDE